MFTLIKLLNMIRTSKLFFVVVITVQVLAISVIAKEHEHEVFNQLYQEIIGSAPAGKSFSIDSLQPSTGNRLLFQDSQQTVTPEGALTDPASEQLKMKIEKVINEVETRQSEAVKFMQDAR